MAGDDEKTEPTQAEPTQAEPTKTDPDEGIEPIKTDPFWGTDDSDVGMKLIETEEEYRGEPGPEKLGA